LDQALKLAESLHDVPSQLICYLPLWGRKIRAALYDDALDSAQRCAEAAKKAPDPCPAAMGRVDAGHYQALSWPPRRSAGASSALAGHRHRERAARASQCGRYDRRVATLGSLASTLWLQGFPSRPSNWECAHWRRPSRFQFALPVSVAMTSAGFNRYLSDTDIDAVEHDIVELMEHARTHSIGDQLGIGHCLLGFVSDETQSI